MSNSKTQRLKNSTDVTPEMAARIKTLLKLGLKQHDIAAQFGINQGRVSEINTGRLYPHIAPTILD